MLSPWNIHQTKNDFIIIGGGLIGLSTAIHLKQSSPKASVLVLERGVVPMGATTRNAGFSCMGSLSEVLNDYRKLGPAAIQQYKDRFDGIAALRKLLGDEAIGYQATGNYELLGSDLIGEIDSIDKLNATLKNYGLYDNTFELQSLKITTFKFSHNYVKELVFNRFEGQINSGKLYNSLVSFANHLGVKINYGSNVKHIDDKKMSVDVYVKNLGDKNEIKFTANKAAVCLNGNTKALLPQYSIEPARGNVILTKPLENPVLFNAPCHIDQGFYYFRPYEGNRILLGGGRNLDFEKEKTTSLSLNNKIVESLKTLLKDVIIPGDKFEVETAWAGTMGFSDTCLPIIEKVKGMNNVVIGFGCNGVGVARGVVVGKETAKLLEK